MWRHKALERLHKHKNSTQQPPSNKYNSVLLSHGQMEQQQKQLRCSALAGRSDLNRLFMNLFEKPCTRLNYIK